jgi:hypothetical protein
VENYNGFFDNLTTQFDVESAFLNETRNILENNQLSNTEKSFSIVNLSTQYENRLYELRIHL